MKYFFLWLLAIGVGAVGLAAQPAGGVIAASAEEVRPLAVGNKAPVAVLTGQDGSEVDLAKVFASKPTIVIFYRGGWCPYCNRHLAALAEAELDLLKLGYQVVAISPEPIQKLGATAEEHHLRYRLLSDEKTMIAKSYGVAYRISKESGAGYKENGIELTHIPGSEDFWLPAPAAFIVDRAGMIKFVYWNADPSIRIGNAELVAAAKNARE